MSASCPTTAISVVQSRQSRSAVRLCRGLRRFLDHPGDVRGMRNVHHVARPDLRRVRIHAPGVEPLEVRIDRVVPRAAPNDTCDTSLQRLRGGSSVRDEAWLIPIDTKVSIDTIVQYARPHRPRQIRARRVFDVLTTPVTIAARSTVGAAGRPHSWTLPISVAVASSLPRPQPPRRASWVFSPFPGGLTP